MKKLTLTISILLVVGITAQAMRYLPNQNTFRTVTNAQNTNNCNENHGESLEMELSDSSLDTSINESIHIKKETKMKNATILHQANEFVKKGNYEDFLTHCTPDTKWVFVGERILEGKDKVRAYMKEFYVEPPVFTVETTIEEGSMVTVTGEITLKAPNGIYHHYDYCDIWRFENGKIAELKAFVIEKENLDK